MQISTNEVLKILYILSWIIFVGVCIEAGGFIFNSFFTLVINPIDAKYFWPGVDLSSLYQYDRGYFFVITLEMIIAMVMRAILFYLIIKILHDKKLDMSQPFNNEVKQFMFKVSYLSLVIGIHSWLGVKYSEWLVTKGVQMPGVEALQLGGGDVWLFMSVTFFVIAQIFKKGIEIQSENELTI